MGLESLSAMLSDFRQRDQQRHALDRVRAAIESAPKYQETLRDLIERPLGARWLLKSIKGFTDEFPRSIVSAVRIRASRSEPAIFRPRLRTPDELADYDSANAPDDDATETERRRYEQSDERRYVTERIGAFSGLEAFVDEPPRRVLFQDLQPVIASLHLATAESMTSKQRSKLLPWLRDYDSSIALVDRWLDAGIKFFGSDDNFSLLQSLDQVSADDKHAAGKIRWDFANGGRRSSH